MFLLGIDIAKLNHVASFDDSSSGELIFSNFKFQNNILEFSSFLEKILLISSSKIDLKLRLLTYYKHHIFVKLTLEILKMIDLILFTLRKL